MVLNVLTTRPLPPNSNFQRSMFFWSGIPGSADPLDTDLEVNAITDFLDNANVGCNVIYLDIWRYIGKPNWTNARRDRLHAILDVWHRSGIKVYALCGNVDWGNNHSWVENNIVEPIIAFNAMATDPTKQFDGICLDVEYWTNETLYWPSLHCPGLCELMKAMKKRSRLEVGCFTAFHLKDNTSTRAEILYNGVWAQDGAHLINSCDFIVVGAYRDHANFGGSESGPGQIALFQPWYDYANLQNKNMGLFCGTETTNVSPAYITYFGASKASMETQHALISNQFQVVGNSIFLGQSIHSYVGWSVMT